MEPVPVTRKVRRTVRMAVALVVGQAMLCALIGWLTLGRHQSEPARSPGSAVVDQLAVPPLAPTGATSAPPPPSRSAISATKQTRKPASIVSPRPAPARSTSAIPAAPPRSPEPILAPPEDPEVVPPVPPTTSPTPLPKPPLLPTSPASTPMPSESPGFVQDPVRVGDECHPVGAYGRTVEGDLVRCTRDWRHGPRWKIV
ncbi:hypothetical protein [Paractinoplanes lichenicola]|uniref:Uncharacterized protein n=1 Tax=Paractinoplanes lichenicola TaxID=2802976 RepID=A0ABS1VL40_9ACTN|nr:hypothetical protein [Actinoplanes lichenicola]MBL7255201.1 hypothetical protein [Actinoplanes lichenicola]